MVHLTIRADGPTGDCIEVLIRKCDDWRHILQLTPISYDLGPCGLEIAGFIPGAALKYCRATIPSPRHSETRESFRQYRLLQRGLCPALPAVGRNHNLRDTSRAGVCN